MYPRAERICSDELDRMGQTVADVTLGRRSYYSVSRTVPITDRGAPMFTAAKSCATLKLPVK